MDRRLRREIAQTPRNTLTGVVTGTEAVTILPSKEVAATSRTACLMIHGFMSSPQDFNNLGELIAEQGITVRKMRLPGHGTTPVDFAFQEPDSIWRAAGLEYTALRKEFDRVYLVGFSMGGALSTLLAASEEVDGIVLVAPYYEVTYEWYYVLPPKAWQALLGRVIDYLPRYESFIMLNDRSQVGKFFEYRTLPTRGVAQLMALGKRARQGETQKKVTCPVLLVHSQGDGASCPKAAQRAFDNFSSDDKTIKWFDSSNHIMLWDYQREEVKSAIVEFFVRISSAPAS